MVTAPSIIAATSQASQAANVAAAGSLLTFILALPLILSFLTIFNIVLTILTVARCMKECPQPDRLTWILIILMVPFVGWVMYRYMVNAPQSDSPPMVENFKPLPPRKPDDFDSRVRSGINTPFTPKMSDEEIIDKRKKEIDEKRRFQNLRHQVEQLAKVKK